MTWKVLDRSHCKGSEYLAVWEVDRGRVREGVAIRWAGLTGVKASVSLTSEFLNTVIKSIWLVSLAEGIISCCLCHFYPFTSSCPRL